MKRYRIQNRSPKNAHSCVTLISYTHPSMESKKATYPIISHLYLFFMSSLLRHYLCSIQMVHKPTKLVYSDDEASFCLNFIFQGTLVSLVDEWY
jgi:hypothetical protein